MGAKMYSDAEMYIMAGVSSGSYTRSCFPSTAVNLASRVNLRGRLVLKNRHSMHRKASAHIVCRVDRR